MQERIKEPRYIMLVLFYIVGFFTFVVIKAEGETVAKGNYWAMMKDRYIWSAKLLAIVPIAIFVLTFIFSEKIAPKLVYLIGGAVGLLVTIFLMISGGKRVASYNGGDPKPGLGFWLNLVVWLSIVVWTLIKDYGMSKDSISEKGLQGSISDIANQSKNFTGTNTNGGVRPMQNIDYAGFATNIISGISRIGEKVCPICGYRNANDDIFCANCGNELDIKKEKKTKDEFKRITVSEYIKTIKNYKCEKCGERVTGSDKYCPGCGSLVVWKDNPEKCENCGEQLMEGCTYCPECGEKVSPVILQTNCKKCGADLLYGKNFCINCGEKI